MVGWNILKKQKMTWGKTGIKQFWQEQKIGKLIWFMFHAGNVCQSQASVQLES